MPIPVTVDLPVPLLEEEFEGIVADALRIRFDNQNLVRLGRRGQSQGGIDGGDFTAARDESLVWQATLAQDIKNKIADDLATLDADPRGQPRLFIAAVGRKRDTPLQLHFQEVSSARAVQGKCPVMPHFWDDTREALGSKIELLRKWYPSFFPDDPFKESSKESSAFCPMAPTDSQYLEGHREALRRVRVMWFLSKEDAGWTDVMNDMLAWFSTNEVFLTEAAAAAFMAVERWRAMVSLTDGRIDVSMFKEAEQAFATLRKELLRFRKI